MQWHSRELLFLVIHSTKYSLNEKDKDPTSYLCLSLKPVDGEQFV